MKRDTFTALRELTVSEGTLCLGLEILSKPVLSPEDTCRMAIVHTYHSSSRAFTVPNDMKTRLIVALLSFGKVTDSYNPELRPQPC